MIALSPYNSLYRSFWETDAEETKERLLKEEKKKKSKVEKPFTLPKHLFQLVDFRGMGIVDEPKHSIPRFVIGELYALQGIACDGFKMKEKVYELVGVIDDFKGTEINSVIVKQVSGESGKIFTLSKNDCACLNIEYENGLQLFPKNLPWKLVKDEVPFECYDLGTNPVSNIDNTIRHILIRIDGFKDYRDGYVITPSGKIIKEKQFEKSLTIKAKEPIVYGNGFKIDDFIKLSTKIVYPKDLLYNHGNFISSDDTIYVLITLKKYYDDAPTKEALNGRKADTIDGYFGVEREYLYGVNPNEFFEITWDEFNAKSIEAYEEEKIKKAKEAEEEIKKAELRKKAEEFINKEKKKKVKKETTKINDIWDVIYGRKPKRITYSHDGSSFGLVRSLDKMSTNYNSYFSSLIQSIDDLGESLYSIADTFEDMDLFD